MKNIKKQRMLTKINERKKIINKIASIYFIYIQEVLMKTFLNFINRRKKFSTFVLLNV